MLAGKKQQQKFPYYSFTLERTCLHSSNFVLSSEVAHDDLSTIELKDMNFVDFPTPEEERAVEASAFLLKHKRRIYVG